MALWTSADRVRAAIDAVVATRGITLQQYNVLRILRGAEPDGLPTLAIGERMIERTPGITRMIDRLEAKGLVARERRSGDRRCVHVKISRTGLELLAGLDRKIDAADRGAFATLSDAELSRLTELLERVRDAHESESGR
ncbi:MAG TPA: MarR family transcriptional regulator [Candidatus Krumholzibacteria bacterium]|nr:MarR family transcriptional regulator [Candidatus Krumholzibacteria bacterium]